MAKRTLANTGAKKSRKPKPFIVRDRTRAQYNFGPDEIGKLGRELGDAQNAKNTLEEQKKNIVKEYASKISEQTARINSLTNKVTSGYEMREVECFVAYDRETRVKTYHVITPKGKPGETIRSEPMTESDFGLLPMDQPAPVVEEPKKEKSKKKSDAGASADEGAKAGNNIADAFKDEDERIRQMNTQDGNKK